DGLDLVGAPAALLAMDQDWERPIIEGPSMLAKDGTYFLFYSANWYASEKYAIGYATCTGPAGPCKKMTVAGPLVKSDGPLLGPGGQEFFTDARGDTWMAFHAWDAPKTNYVDGGSRKLRVGRLVFDAGVPAVEMAPRASTLAVDQ